MRVLVAQARAAARGGAEAYAAALIEVLRDDGHAVGHVDIDGHLSPDGPCAALPGAIPGRILWNWAQVCRALPRLATGYDRVILAFGEGPELPVPSLAVRHAPAIFSMDARLLQCLGARPSLHRLAYIRACRQMARITGPNGASLSLANTAWTAHMAQRHDGAQIDGLLYPPVPAACPGPGPRRPFRLLALGRITPNKRLEEAVAILDRLHATGLPAELEICGRVTGRTARQLARRLAQHPHVCLTANADAGQKSRALSEATLGLHMFHGEHFGIAVAEMIGASVVPLVHDAGGVRELVTDPGLRFRTIDDAAAIAQGLLLRPDRRVAAHAALSRGPALARAHRFEAEARAALSGFLARPASAHAA